MYCQYEGRYVAIYIRKSREEKDKAAHRLEAQREQLPAHAESQGWKYRIYDDGYASASKEKIGNLFERAKLEQDIKAGKVWLILVIELSRLSRDETLEDYVSWISLCNSHNVKLGTMSRILDPQQQSDWMLLLMEGGFSKIEYSMIKIRMEQGRQQAYLKGKWQGGTPPSPYAYDAKEKKLVVVEDELSKLKELWKSAETMSAKAVARRLKMAEITVRRAISDQRLLFCQAKRLDPKTNAIIECDWQPVIDQDQAALIATSRKSRRNYKTRRNAGGLLSNLQVLYCGYCGKTIKVWNNSKTRSDGSRVDYYGCQSKGDKGVCLKGRLVQQHHLDHRVVTNLFGTLKALDDLKLYWISSQVKSDPEIELKALADREKKLIAQLDNVVGAIANGIIKPDHASRKIAEIESNLKSLEQAKMDVSTQTVEPPDWDALDFKRDEFEKLDFNDKRLFIIAAIEKIAVYDSYAIIYYRFPRTPDGETAARIHLPKRNKPSEKDSTAKKAAGYVQRGTNEGCHIHKNQHR